MPVATGPVSGISFIAPRPETSVGEASPPGYSYPIMHQTFPYISWPGLRAA
jgi:hypothetical protein